MENSKNYTVMELAEAVGVPRTTINDWLNRYGQYIVSIPQGKRKVYPESALKILLQVALLRNEGNSFAQIEEALGKTFPIKAEPVQVSAAQSSGPEEFPEETKSEPHTAPSGSGTEQQNPENEFALIARRQSEEITRMIGESFRNMDERIRELEEIARTRKKLSCIWFGAFLVFLLLLGGVSYGAWHFLNKSAKEKEVLLHQQQQTAHTVASLREQSVTLIAESKNFKANAARLEKELAQQKKEFAKSLETQRKDLTALHKAREQTLDARRAQALSRAKESEMKYALEKERFASERLAMLKEMEALKKQLSAAKKLVAEQKAKGKKTVKQPAQKTGDKAVKKPVKKKAVSAPVRKKADKTPAVTKKPIRKDPVQKQKNTPSEKTGK